MLRTILYTICFCWLYSSATAQEFPAYKNGLIYSKETINKVKALVDSVNKASRKTYTKDLYSIEQGIFHIAILLENNWPIQKKDIGANMAYADFISKYPKTERQENIHISRQGHKMDSSGCYMFYTYQLEPFDRIYIQSIYSILNEPDTSTIPFFNLEDSIATCKYFFAIQDFKKYKLPVKYASKIHYGNAFFDMNTKMYPDIGFRCMHDYKTDEFAPNVDTFLSYAKTQKNINNKYLDKLDLAINEAMQFMRPMPELEYYVLRLKPKIIYLQLLLKTQRSFVATGDNDPNSSPRKLALEIATMAAIEGNIDLFLRMHLDLVTDNFKRQDFNHDWKKQRHYLKELEIIGIDVSDLLIGLLLKGENSPGHYYADDYNLAYAIAKYEKSKNILDDVFSAIADKDLDIVNRILLYDLYRRAVSYMEGDSKAQGIATLKRAKQTLPLYYQSQRELEY